MWTRLLSSTNQPSFLCNKVIEEARKEHERVAQLLDGSPSHQKLEKVPSSKSSGK
jgi:6-phosphofructokinase 1